MNATDLIALFVVIVLGLLFTAIVGAGPPSLKEFFLTGLPAYIQAIATIAAAYYAYSAYYVWREQENAKRAAALAERVFLAANGAVVGLRSARFPLAFPLKCGQPKDDSWRAILPVALRQYEASAPKIDAAIAELMSLEPLIGLLLNESLNSYAFALALCVEDLRRSANSCKALLSSPEADKSLSNLRPDMENLGLHFLEEDQGSATSTLGFVSPLADAFDCKITEILTRLKRDLEGHLRHSGPQSKQSGAVG